jgi:Fe2+ transport system protein B
MNYFNELEKKLKEELGIEVVISNTEDIEGLKEVLKESGANIIESEKDSVLNAQNEMEEDLKAIMCFVEKEKKIKISKGEAMQMLPLMQKEAAQIASKRGMNIKIWSSIKIKDWIEEGKITGV